MFIKYTIMLRLLAKRDPKRGILISNGGKIFNMSGGGRFYTDVWARLAPIEQPASFSAWHRQGISRIGHL